MDKFAVLQLKKKRAKEEEDRAKGLHAGDVLAVTKQTISEEELDSMNEAFGYLKSPAACYAVSKESSAGLWWVWENPHPPFTPIDVRDSDDEDADAEAQEADAAQAAKAGGGGLIRGLSGWFGGASTKSKSGGGGDDEEGEMEEIEFDEDGNVIEKELTPQQKKAKEKADKEKAERKAENARLAELYKGKPKIKCPTCSKKNRYGTTCCNSCGKPMPGLSPRSQAKKEEMDRREKEEREKIQFEKDEAKRAKRKVKEDYNNEQISMRIKGWMIHRYRKDPFKPGGKKGSGVGAGVSNYSDRLRGADDDDPEAPLDGTLGSLKGRSGGSGGSSPVRTLQAGLQADANGIWRKKGSTFVPLKTEHGKIQMMHIVDDLPDNYEYRFTICAVNGRGCSKESPCTDSVMVEKPLPAGWNRFYDEKARKFYYANMKISTALWSRPDSDPYFLEECILLEFKKREINYLRKLYDEEIAHFNAVFIERFTDVLLEVGEKMSKPRIMKLFTGYAANEHKLNSWKQFMDIMAHIKRKKKEGGDIMGKIASVGNIGMIMKKRLTSRLLSNEGGKMGNWALTYSIIAEKEYYYNKVTKETSWDMPDEIRFFLPAQLHNKLLTAFDFGHIETFKQYYSMLDMNNSGDLTDQEIKILLDALGVKLSPQGLQELIQIVDLNGNGTIEFDEFCWMMYELSRTDKDGALSDLKMDFGGKGKGKGGGSPSQGGTGSPNLSGGGGGGGTGFALDLHSLGAKLTQTTASAATLATFEKYQSEVATLRSSANNSVSGGGSPQPPQQSGQVGQGALLVSPMTTGRQEGGEGEGEGIDVGGVIGTSGYAESTVLFPETQTDADADEDRDADGRGDYTAGAGVVVQDSGMLRPPPPDADTAQGIGSGPASFFHPHPHHLTAHLQVGGDFLEEASVASATAAAATQSGGGGGDDELNDSMGMESESKVRYKPSAPLSPSPSSSPSVSVSPTRSPTSSTRSKAAVVPTTSAAATAGASNSNINSNSQTTPKGKKETAAERKSRREKEKEESKVFEVDEKYNFGDMQYNIDASTAAVAAHEISCPVCGLGSDAFPCQKCYEVRYCSRRCQQDHFSVHKLVCNEKSKEEIAAYREGEKTRKERMLVEQEQARLKAGQEREEREQEAADDKMFDQWEEDGRPLLGPDEEIHEQTGEVCFKHVSWKRKKLNSLFACFFPSLHAAHKEKKRKMQAKVDRRRAKLKAEGDARRLRDNAGKHGPLCFCGCRAY